MNNIRWPLTPYRLVETATPKATLVVKAPTTLADDTIQSPTGLIIPRCGWSCLWVTDLKDSYDETEKGTCAYCGYALLRFVHTLAHSESELRLETGCCCAAFLCKDYDAKEAEQKLKNRFARKERWMTRKWKISQKGNPYLNIGNYNVGIYRDAWGLWGYRVNGEFNGLKYESELAAKLRLFDHLQKRFAW